jgi:hypothetical protein
MQISLGANWLSHFGGVDWFGVVPVIAGESNRGSKGNDALECPWVEGCVQGTRPCLQFVTDIKLLALCLPPKPPTTNREPLDGRA